MGLNTPNEEQVLAIENHGGLLSAGAGSGKTFVIVEHTLYRIFNIFRSTHKKHDDSWIQQFLVFSSRTALLTYTKKASIEMAERLKSRSENVDLPDGLTRDVLKQAVSNVYVGTIHAFLLKLIKEGLISGVENVEIASNEKVEGRINDLIEEKLIQLKDNLPKGNFDKLLGNLIKVKEGFQNIFNDAELRIRWEEMDSVICLNSFWPSFYSYQNMQPLIDKPIDLSRFSSGANSAWYKCLEKLNQALPFPENFSFEDHLDFWESFFSEIKTIRSPSKADLLDVVPILKTLTAFKKDFNTHKDDLKAIIEDKGSFDDFYSSLVKLFRAVNDDLKQSQFITFSTLEYIIHQAHVEKPLLDYLLVDEFQDTSWIQFEIIEKIVEGSWKNIFCVGDKKQAIYRFRGGEIGVFEKTANTTSKLMGLENNYRSHEKVVDFNNKFFQQILHLGSEFSGVSSKSVEMDFQKSASNMIGEEAGASILHLTLSEDQRKRSADELNILESDILMSRIRALIDSGENDLAILYSKLTPSHYLIKNMMKEKISFNAQMKIPLEEQPLLAIIKIILENALLFFPSEEVSGQLIHQILEILGVSTSYEISRERFSNHLEYYDSFFAILKEIQLMGINITDNKNSIELIKVLCEVNGKDLEDIWRFFNQHREDNYSYEFRFKGLTNASVKVMTVHGSKGLEFDHVFIAGIHTNGSPRIEKDIVKKWPGSFKWAPTNQKKLMKSPFYILESHDDKELNLSEQKRLFYVACTRAKRNIFFPYISKSSGEPFYYGKNSWVKGVEYYLNHGGVINSIEIKNEDISIDNYSYRSPPLFHFDDFGLLSSGQGGREFRITSDQSVTNISELAFCPRKYYLSNTIKMDEAFLEYMEERYEQDLPPQYKKFVGHGGGVQGKKSSKDRGSKIHQYIESYILGNGDVQLEETESLEAINFCIDEIKKFEGDYTLLSEYPIKFKFNGQFVYGVCDLVLLNQNESEVKIWDFKTGHIDEKNLSKYKLQLQLYGIAFLQLFSKLNKVDLKVLSLDEKKSYDFILKRSDFGDISKSISELSNRPWEKVEGNCHLCEYRKICQVKMANC